MLAFFAVFALDHAARDMNIVSSSPTPAPCLFPENSDRLEVYTVCEAGEILQIPISTEVLGVYPAHEQAV